MTLDGMWGQYSITIDEKGRMSLPSEIRRSLSGDTMVLTRGLERCLWLYIPEKWEAVKRQLVNKSSVFSLKSQDVLRRLISPAREVGIDKAGRIKLSVHLMKPVGLSRGCYMIGMGERLEIWDEAVYDEFEEQRSPVVRQAWEDLGDTETAS